MTTTTPTLTLLSDLSDALLEEEAAIRKARASGKPGGPVTGFAPLDESLGGFLAPGLHVLMGAPGTGKTAFALQVAAQAQMPALYVTCEMRPLDLLRRVICRTSKIFLGRLRGQLSEPDLKNALQTAVKACPQLAFLDASRQPTDAATILDAASLLRERFQAPHILLLLDSLTDWAATSAGDAREYEANEAALNALKQIGAALSCPVLTVVHRNRVGNKSKEDGEHHLHSGKGTGRVEYIAETVLNLSLAGSPSPIAEVKAVTLTLLKNRNGKRGEEVSLLFEGRLQEFRLP